MKIPLLERVPELTRVADQRREAWWARAVDRNAGTLAAVLLFLGTLAVYVRTAAPSVLSGDSAEFQLAAPLLGVPHPTTYPLYVLLAKLATLVLPFGDIAHRVTLVSTAAAALAVVLLFLLARRLTGATSAALLAALALAVAPGLWNAATIAEVYALLAALLALTGWQLARSHTPAGSAALLLAFVAGLGATHHGLYVLTGLPLALLGCTAAVMRTSAERRARAGARLLAAFVLGLTPLLYPLLQFAHYGPFDGNDYGLPRHYFWGAPRSWGEVLALITGGPLRQNIFRMPSAPEMLSVLRMLAERMWFEFGPTGCAIGVVGCLVHLLRQRIAWMAGAWVAGVTTLYLLLLGPAVQDAPVFTLPILLPWSLWIAVGAAALAGSMLPHARLQQGDLLSWRTARFALVTATLLVATLAWGDTRVEHSSKRQLWLYRQFGEATLRELPPDAVVITRWEQGMTLQYLVLVEHQRSDVWIDVVEPDDEPWGQRALRRYPDRAVFLVGQPEDVIDLPVEPVREGDYAWLFRLRQ